MNHHPTEISRTARRRGFTLIELLVVIAIIGVLVSLTLVAINAARSSANSLQCRNNLRQLALTFRDYAASHRDRMLDEEDEPWFIQLGRHSNLPLATFKCPMGPEEAEIHYDWRDSQAMDSASELAGKRFNMVAHGGLLLVFDSIPGWHMPEFINAAAVDGSVDTYAVEDFEDNLLLSVTSGEPYFLEDDPLFDEPPLELPE